MGGIQNGPPASTRSGKASTSYDVTVTKDETEAPRRYRAHLSHVRRLEVDG